ncbi:MAG TPA: hydroxyacid dehydrogenase [Candidatus Marinimicrobia bacterium]|nr:hydroxyacid dehydrogenase [Candidatus Neomarinimicrobiota bacterium]
MNIYDVYFYEAFDEEERQIRQFLPETIRAGFTYKTIQECDHLNAPARIISTRTQTIIPDLWLTEAEAFLTRSTGYDYFQSLKNKAGQSVHFGYLPLYCARAVAEQAMLLWMALWRKLPQQTAQFKTFHRDGLTGRESRGKSLLVVGVGNIGYEVVQIGRGLDMIVRGVDIVRKHNDVDYVDFDEALPEADIIVSAMNLTPENTGYFRYERLKKAKPGALFVNVARGEQSPPSGLKRLLDENILGGIALDVYPFENELGTALRMNSEINNEELKIIQTLSRYPNVIFTPHNAFNTAESVERKAEQSVEQVRHFTEKGSFLWNVPNLTE